MDILSDKPLFFLISSYTKGITPTILSNVMETSSLKKLNGKITCDEIGIKMSKRDMVLPCGICGRWESND